MRYRGAPPLALFVAQTEVYATHEVAASVICGLKPAKTSAG